MPDRGFDIMSSGIGEDDRKGTKARMKAMTAFILAFLCPFLDVSVLFLSFVKFQQNPVSFASNCLYSHFMNFMKHHPVIKQSGK